MAAAGQTPAQLWQNVQLRNRVEKSLLIAANEHTWMHRPHFTQAAVTLRSLSRNTLQTESSAPVGQT